MIQESILPEFRTRIRLLHLDTLVTKLLKEASASWLCQESAIPTSLLALAEFAEKYLPGFDADRACLDGEGEG